MQKLTNKEREELMKLRKEESQELKGRRIRENTESLVREYGWLSRYNFYEVAKLKKCDSYNIFSRELSRDIKEMVIADKKSLAKEISTLHKLIANLGARILELENEKNEPR